MIAKQKFFKISLISFALFCFSWPVFAGQFPNDAITIRISNDTGQDIFGQSILTPGEYTILNTFINSKDDRPNTIFCNSVTFLKQRNIEYIDFNSNYLCIGTITADLYRTSTISMTYVPYNLRTVPTNIGNFTLDNGATFTSGDMFVGFLLIIYLIIALTVISVKAVKGVKIYKTYTGVNQLEGKEHYEI